MKKLISILCFAIASITVRLRKNSALNNFMDYNNGTDNRTDNRNMFFKYQMQNSK